MANGGLSVRAMGDIWGHTPDRDPGSSDLFVVPSGTFGRLVGRSRVMGSWPIVEWDMAYRVAAGVMDYEVLEGVRLDGPRDLVKVMFPFRGETASRHPDPVAATRQALDDADDSDPAVVGLRDAAAIVGLEPDEIEASLKAGSFLSPHGYIKGRPYWEADAIVRWRDFEAQGDDVEDDVEDDDDDLSCECPVDRIAAALERLADSAERSEPDIPPIFRLAPAPEPISEPKTTFRVPAPGQRVVVEGKPGAVSSIVLYGLDVTRDIRLNVRMNDGAFLYLSPNSITPVGPDPQMADIVLRVRS